MAKQARKITSNFVFLAPIMENRHRPGKFAVKKKKPAHRSEQVLKHTNNDWLKTPFTHTQH